VLVGKAQDEAARHDTEASADETARDMPLPTLNACRTDKEHDVDVTQEVAKQCAAFNVQINRRQCWRIDAMGACGDQSVRLDLPV